MSKDKDDDKNKGKDNVLNFPNKKPVDSKIYKMYVPKDFTDDEDFGEFVESFSPEELHNKMQHLDTLYEKCFHFTNHLQFMMHIYSQELDTKALTALEEDLKELFLKYPEIKG
jgi:hypothetical protein